MDLTHDQPAGGRDHRELPDGGGGDDGDGDGDDGDAFKLPTERSAPRGARQSEPRAWHVSERGWRENRQLAESITVSRVAQRLEAQKHEVLRARQLRVMAAARSSVQRETVPGEWAIGERRWRHHQAQVESSVQARAAERMLLDQQKRLTSEVSRTRASEEHHERRRDEREGIRRHRLIAGHTTMVVSNALAEERRRQMKQRLATFDANVQRKRLGLPRIESEQPSAPSWEEFGLSRVRTGTLPILAAATGLQLARPLSTGAFNRPTGSRPNSRARLLAQL
ncbi:hypothetical protein T492DRAFT_885534 [Pavlovales sp. CCMP2436]|nr:hypothetical protein T492DRAFT_885534 [Pavlovales sp. CCMP2436]